MWGGISAFLILSWLWALSSNSLSILILGVFCACLYPIFFRREWYKAHDRQVKKLYGEGLNKRILCIHELELRDQYLKESSEFGTQETKFAAIEKVEAIPTHGFIYIASILAYVVPRAKVIEGNFDEFIKAVASKVEDKQA